MKDFSYDPKTASPRVSRRISAGINHVILGDLDLERLAYEEPGSEGSAEDPPEYRNRLARRARRAMLRRLMKRVRKAEVNVQTADPIAARQYSPDEIRGVAHACAASTTEVRRFLYGRISRKVNDDDVNDRIGDFLTEGKDIYVTRAT